MYSFTCSPAGFAGSVFSRFNHLGELTELTLTEATTEIEGPPPPANAAVKEAMVTLKAALDQHFRGDFAALSRIPVAMPHGTPDCHWKILTTLRDTVPAGQVISYKDLAERAGHPGAARTVGTAMSHNRICLVLPCHRVVPSSAIAPNGSIRGAGAYSQGVDMKMHLLQHEGLVCKPCTK